MKKITFLLALFFFIFSCKNEPVPTCENGHYDEGEIGVDCGGNCPDCIFDKNDVLDKNWEDIESDLLQVEELFIKNHTYSSENNYFFALWGYQNSGGGFISALVPNWNWINESDTLKFDWITTEFLVKRKIVFVGDDFYKFKTNQDDWEYIHTSILRD